LAVSTNLYRALQTAQGINFASLPGGDANFAPENAPNIYSAQYTSLAAQSGGYKADWSPILGATGVGKAINVARRVRTSGTQASSNIFFLGNPCSAGAFGALAPATAADSIPGAFIVTEGSSTGNVKTTITSANNAGQFAIGVLSLENDWRVEGAANAQYRFVKVDNVHPEVGSQLGTNSNGRPFYTARQTAINGEYPFHMEMHAFTATPTAQTGTYGAVVIQDILVEIGHPVICATTPRGLTISPLAGSTCDGTVVAKGTRFGNNCKDLQLFF